MQNVPRPPLDDAALDRLAAAAGLPGLQLLVLIGSHARGSAHDASDVDLAFQADRSFDPALAIARWSRALGRDDIDLVDLRRASALLRHRAGDEGRVVWEDRAGRMLGFREESALFWSDAQWVIEQAQGEVMGAL